MDNSPQGQRVGLLETTLQKLLARSAQVRQIETIGASFHLLTLGGAALRGVDWTPGDKLQIMLGGWVQRTYTPLDWDATEGSTRILVYLHGDAPGTRWARALQVGDSCFLFGPRKSVRLAPAASPVILFGDESSLGLAAALAPQHSLQMWCEASARDDVLAVIDRLELPAVQLAASGERADGLIALLQAQPMADLVLTGPAAGIQRVSRLLRAQGHGGRRQSKAYWAAGKTGLD